MKYLWSKYNYSFKLESGSFVFYNFLSNAIFIVDEKEYNRIITLKLKDNLKINDISKYLLESKVFVTSDEKEVNLIIDKRLTERNLRALDLFISPTLKCNFECNYCYQKEVEKTQMTKETIDLLVDFITTESALNSLDRIALTWLGGEPLLDTNNIIYISKKINNKLDLIKVSRPEILNTLITNGYLIDEAIKNNLFEEIDFSIVQVTIDGLESFHNNRRSNSKNSNFDKILSNIEKLNRLYPNILIIVRSNLDRNNKNEFINLFNHLKSKILNSNVRISPAFVEDRSSTCSLCDTVLSKNDQGRFFLELYNNNNLVFTDFHPKVTTYSCMAFVENSYAIDPLGYVYKCVTFVGKKELACFHLSDRAVVNPKFLNIPFQEIDYLFIESCKNCTFFPICDGGCPIKRANPKYLSLKEVNCHISKDILDDFLKSHIKIKESYENC